jgi:hypothetical protein
VLVEQLAALFEEEPRAVKRTRGLLAPPPTVQRPGAEGRPQGSGVIGLRLGLGAGLAAPAAGPLRPRKARAAAPADRSGQGRARDRGSGHARAAGRLQPAKTSLEGGFTYAGGVALTSTDTSRLHGLSDLAIAAGRFAGRRHRRRRLLRGPPAAGRDRRLVGLTDGKLEPLRGLDGQALQGKEKGDAEGLAMLPNGDRLVSFERDHRIWLYPSTGPGTWGAPRAVPKPATVFPDNEGMEAIAAYPFAGPDAYLVGGEEGEVWLCRLSTACQSMHAATGAGLHLGPDRHGRIQRPGRRHPASGL